MWVITRDGFVSLVEHNTNPDLIRARARRREHLVDTFALDDDDVIDLGPNCPDYRWHAEIPRANVAQAMYDAVMDLDYASHVKEEVAGPDNVMYSAMLGCWRELHRLQEPIKRDPDWWWDRTAGDDTPADGSFKVLDDITTKIVDLAEKMQAGGRRTSEAEPSEPLQTQIWAGDNARCVLCADDMISGDHYVNVPESFLSEAGPAHVDCAQDFPS